MYYAILSANTTSAMDSSALNSSAMDSSALDSSAREAALRKRRERDRIRRASESSEQREARLSRRRLADRERDKEEIGTFALGRVLNRVRRDSLSEDLRIEKELGRVADRRLRRNGKLRLARRRVADRSRRVSQYMYIIIILLKFTHVSNYDNSKALHAIYMLLSAIGMWLKYK